MRLPRTLARTALGISFFIWGAAVGAPLLALVLRPGAFQKLFDPSVIRLAEVTFAQAAISTLLAVMGGLLLGLQVGKLGGALARACEALLEMPFVIPSVVAAAAWVTWLGSAGILAFLGLRLDWLYSWKAIIIAHVFYNLPWVALAVARARREIPTSLLDAASTLGAGPWQKWRRVLLPETQWALASAALQAFSLSVMSFALILILGGGLPIETLETGLYARIRYGTLDLSGASACAIWELVLTLGPWAGVLFLRQKQASSGRKLGSRAHFGKSKKASRPRALALLAACAIWLVPVLAVLGHFHLPPGVGDPLSLSLRLAFVSSLLAVVVAALSVLATQALSEKGWGLAASLFLVPGGISALVLGLGFWMAYRDWVDPFEGSFLAMAAVQATLFFPVAYRIFWPFAQTVETRRIEAAVTLGASPMRAFFELEGKRWMAPLLSALALCFSAAIGEVAVVSLFYSENLVPLPLLLSRLMTQYRFEEAQGVSALLLLLCVAGILVIGVFTSLVLKEDPGTEAVHGIR